MSLFAYNVNIVRKIVFIWGIGRNDIACTDTGGVLGHSKCGGYLQRKEVKHLRCGAQNAERR